MLFLPIAALTWTAFRVDFVKDMGRAESFQRFVECLSGDEVSWESFEGTVYKGVGATQVTIAKKVNGVPMWIDKAGKVATFTPPTFHGSEVGQPTGQWTCQFQDLFRSWGNCTYIGNYSSYNTLESYSFPGNDRWTTVAINRDETRLVEFFRPSGSSLLNVVTRETGSQEWAAKPSPVGLEVIGYGYPLLAQQFCAARFISASDVVFIGLLTDPETSKENLDRLESPLPLIGKSNAPSRLFLFVANVDTGVTLPKAIVAADGLKHDSGPNSECLTLSGSGHFLYINVNREIYRVRVDLLKPSK